MRRSSRLRYFELASPYEEMPGAAIHTYPEMPVSNKERKKKKKKQIADWKFKKKEEKRMGLKVRDDGGGGDGLIMQACCTHECQKTRIVVWTDTLVVSFRGRILDYFRAVLHELWLIVETGKPVWGKTKRFSNKRAKLITEPSDLIHVLRQDLSKTWDELLIWPL